MSKTYRYWTQTVAMKSHISTKLAVTSYCTEHCFVVSFDSQTLRCIQIYFWQTYNSNFRINANSKSNESLQN